MIQTLKRIGFRLYRYFFNNEDIIVESESESDPDFLFTVDDRAYNAQFRGRSLKGEEWHDAVIEYSIPNLFHSSSGDLDSFLATYHVAELEEMTHWAGEMDVEEDHSDRWIPYLLDIVIYCKGRKCVLRDEESGEAIDSFDYT